MAGLEAVGAGIGTLVGRFRMMPFVVTLGAMTILRGAELETDIGPDAALLGTTVLSRFADRALQLLADQPTDQLSASHLRDRV